jgi:hypothetical protein
MTEGVFERELRIDPSIGTIEVKITAQARDEDEVLEHLERVDAEAEDRQVWFFDTPDLTLFESGLVLRVRKIDGGTDDSTVKLRPVDPTELSDFWKGVPGFEVELDAVGGKAICSAKLSVDQRQGEIQAVVAGEREVWKLFSRDQERLVADFGPVKVDWSTLVPLGPVDVRKWEIKPKGLDYEVTVEEWVLPDRSDLVELSVKAPPEEARTANERFRAWLDERGFDTGGDQQTKTRAALQYFTTGQGMD